VDGISCRVDELEKMRDQEAAMECIGAMGEEVTAGERMGTLKGDASDGWRVWVVLDLEDESGSERRMTIRYVGEQEAIRLHGINCCEQTAGSGFSKPLRSFEHRWSSMAAFGRALRP
jgi:hypothetical protein